MKRALTFLFTLAMCGVVFADHVPTTAYISSWAVETGEEVWAGTPKYKAYRIGNMFDGDPRTAWVFNETKLDAAKEQEFGDLQRTSIQIRSKDYYSPEGSTGFVADGIRLMNGYNKSSEVFKRNNRIIELALYSGGKILKKVRLSDKPGWHSIKLPRKQYHDIEMVVTRVAKGIDNDVCISELQVLNGGKSVGPTVENAYIYTKGDSCGCGTDYEVLNRDGTKLTKAQFPGEAQPEWNANGELFAGLGHDKGDTSIYVIDLSKGRVALKRRVRERTHLFFKWIGSRTLKVSDEKKTLLRKRF